MIESATRERRGRVRRDAWFAHWMDRGEDQYTTWRLGPLELQRSRYTAHVLGWHNLQERSPIWTDGQTKWTLTLSWSRTVGQVNG